MDNGAQKETISLSLICFYAGTLIISLTTFRPVASFFNASDTLFLLSMILLVIHLLYEGKSPLRVFVHNNPFFYPFLVFALGALMSLIHSDALGTALTVIGKYIFLFCIWLPAGIYLLNSPRRISGMLVVLLAAALVPLIPGISDYYFDTRITAAIDRLLAMNLQNPTPHGGRFGSVMGHPNNFGFMLVVVFPVAIWLAISIEAIWKKCLALLFLCLLLAGGLVTGSRSMALAMSIQIIFFLVFLPLKTLKQKIAYFLAFIFLITGLVMLTVKAKPVILMDRFVEMATYELGEYEPDVGRIDYMLEAWKAIRAHPFAGIGVEHTGVGVEAIGVHNTILRLGAGIGIWGVIFSCWIYLLAFARGIKNLRMAHRAGNRYYASVSFVLLASLVGWSVVDMVQPQFYDRFKFVTLTMIFSLSSLIDRDEAGVPSFPLKRFEAPANA